jgi:hypothetical protein
MIYSHIEYNKCYIVDSQTLKVQHEGQQILSDHYIVDNQKLKAQH